MRQPVWIMSDGGPLICMESHLVPEWGGIDPAMGNSLGSESDYDRACRSAKYLETIDLHGGLALIIGDAPLDTAFWQSSTGQLYLVRVWYCEADFDVEGVMRSLPPSVFDNPVEALDFVFKSSQLALFDSACPGLEASGETVAVDITPGKYRILTVEFLPDDSTSLILHRFDRQ